MPALSDFNLPTLTAQLQTWGHPTSHARRLLRALYQSPGKVTFNDTQLGNSLRARLATDIALRQSTIAAEQQSADGTVKLLLAMANGGSVETVLMPSHRPDRAAGCVSSQIGCAMRCDFCASTRNGLERDLSAGEIVEQFLHLKERAATDNRRLQTLVFMGMGEPMLNLDNVLEAIRRIAGPDLGQLGGRHITVSTVGIVPGIDRLAAAGLNVHLAISLHAPDDATRARLVPMNRRYNIPDIMAAARRFESITHRIPTIEYCLLAGLNDSDEQAHLLANLMENFRAHVNLIPYNAIGAGVSGTVYERPAQERMNSFLGILRHKNIVAHFRRTRGEDVNAACGQLRDQLTPVSLPVRTIR